MAESENGRIQALLAESWELVRSGRHREAADAFGRILLQDSRHGEARRGLEKAKAGLAEEQRLLDGRFAQARQALEAGESARARKLLEEVVRRGGDRDRALALLDRLDARGGRLEAPAAAEDSAVDPAPVPASRSGWSRRLLVGVWAAVFALMAAGVGSSWERLVGSLVQPPSPSSRLAPAGHLPAPTAGERAVAEARRLLEQGDAGGALRTLDRISPEEPAYPFARQLRGQVEQALRDRGRPR